MIRRMGRPLLVILAAAASGAPASADLKAYFSKPEPAYKWEKRGEKQLDGVKMYDLHLVSQTWQGMNWEHRLWLFRPDNLEHPEFCSIYNTGGSGNARDAAMAARVSKASGCCYAVLYNIPNQPLYGGKTEDALVVYTWLKYIETGDESWPLHFPMAKAVLKSMDALQEFCKQEKLPALTSFMIHGGSKRGWTTWLCGASRDKRIKAIAPMVIDVLNVTAQSKHMMEYYGKPSEQVEDYTRAGIMQKLMTKEGQRLMELEDPYSYRDILTLPKLIILGTNDRYWTQDALNLYWDGLKGPKWVMYTPNSGHGLEDRDRVLNTISAFVRFVAGHKQWPKMQWGYSDAPGGGAELSLKSDMTIREARLFHVNAPTKDFRDSKWTYEPMVPNGSGSGFTGRMDAPAEGYSAIFGEAVYDIDGQSFTLSTQLRVLSPKK